MARILVVTTFYPPHHYGGYELSCRDVVERWRRQGHEVTVLTSSSRIPGVADAVGEPRTEVRRDLRTYFSGGSFTRVPLLERRRFEQTNQRALTNALEATKPDIVSVWQMVGLPLGLLTTLVRSDRRLVCVVCDEWPGYVLRTDKWMRRLLRWPAAWRTVERLSGVPTAVPDLENRASFCFNSHNIRDRCLKSSPWFFPRSTVTYSGISIDDFPVTERAPSEEWAWRLVTAGRLDPRKGFATAIRSLALLPPQATLQVLSVVDEAYRHDLEAIAVESGVADRVSFGLTDRGGLRQAYLHADAFVFPSEWEEPFGLVPVEAMASGTPVVATGTGGSAEFLVDGRTCLRFDPGRHDQLADALNRLAGSTELRQRIIEAGWQVAGELTLDRLADALEEWHLAAFNDFRDGVPPTRDMRTFLSKLRP